jgi:hypothetical protein
MDETKPTAKPPPGFSAFKRFLEKLARVPKAEIDQKEAEYQEERKRVQRARARTRSKAV